MRTQQEIAEECSRLRAIKPLIKRLSFFGDDHHAAIDAQINVLEKRMSRLQTSAAYAEDGTPERPEYVFLSAIDAFEWLHGESFNTPSSLWNGMQFRAG